jgi:dihydroxyacetone kinase-like predicted kinase
MTQNKYAVEFIINIYDSSLEEFRNFLTDLGEGLSLEEREENNGKGRIVKVQICTNDPYLVFDSCSQFGRLKSVKVSEAKTYGV